MKRLVRKVVLFLPLGAILNVAVAWGFAAHAFRTGLSPRIREYTRDDALSPAEVQDLVTHEVLVADGWAFVWDVSRARGVQRREVKRIPSFWLDPVGVQFGFEETVMTTYQIGWPMRSLHMDQWITYSRPGVNIGETVEGGVELPSSFDRVPFSKFEPALPLCPIWPGFAINTMFYAAVLWVPCALIGVIRHRRRITRGLCPACGYDLRGGRGGGSGSTTCPECGKATPSPLRERAG